MIGVTVVNVTVTLGALVPVLVSHTVVVTPTCSSCRQESNYLESFWSSLLLLQTFVRGGRESNDFYVVSTGGWRNTLKFFFFFFNERQLLNLNEEEKKIAA